MSGIDGVELCPRSGKLLSSCVYADLNCVLSISALVLLSLYIKPSLNILIPNVAEKNILISVEEEKKI
jgi:hypothetical protein